MDYANAARKNKKNRPISRSKDVVKLDKPKLDLNNLNVGFIITGLVGMVEDDGLSPRDAFILLDEIKNQTWSALMEISKGKG
jgi:hypothetical protein